MPPVIPWLSEWLSTVPTRTPVCVTWRARVPDAVAGRFRRSGFAVTAAAGWQVDLGGDLVRIEQGGTHDTLVVEPIAVRHPSPSTGRLIAVGVATVDHERLARDLEIELSAIAGEEPSIGARSWSVPGTRLRLLEPSTEGRLAAALARHGEGPIALYLGVGDTGLFVRASPSGPAGPALAPAASGPFMFVTRDGGGRP